MGAARAMSIELLGAYERAPYVAHEVLRRRILDRLVEEPEGHQLWTGGYVQGRPSFTLRRRRHEAARVVHALLRGPLRDGERLRQACDVAGCVAPDCHVVERGSAAAPRTVPPLTPEQVRGVQGLRVQRVRTRPLDAVTVRRVRAMHAAGVAVRALATATGVGVGTVRAIVTGRYYADVV